MKRGQLVTVAVQGDHGKPRPALVVQNDEVDGVDTVLVCLLTSSREGLGSFRIMVDPDAENGLRSVSVVMLDKITMVRRLKCGPVIGRLNEAQMARVDSGLLVVFGLSG